MPLRDNAWDLDALVLGDLPFHAYYPADAAVPPDTSLHHEDLEDTWREGSFAGANLEDTWRETASPLNGADLEDTWRERRIAAADLDDRWAERVPLGLGGTDLEDTWVEHGRPPMAGADLQDRWRERSRPLSANLTDWWREVPDVIPVYTEDVQRPIGRVEEE